MADHLGLELLLDLLTSGTLAHTPAFVPSHQHLSLAATFIVHPVLTTRCKSRDYRQAANTALDLLRATNRLLGPLQAGFDKAFRVTHFESSSSSRRIGSGSRRAASMGSYGGNRHDNYDDDYDDDDGGGGGGYEDGGDGTTNGGGGGGDELFSDPISIADPEALGELQMDKMGSLWSRPEDFWQMVGWAFNCSVLSEKRWERWSLWLDFMCTVMEDDWEERTRMNEATGLDEESKEAKDNWRESLIFQYIENTSGLSDPRRRILKAIFADGKAESMMHFKEIFRNELACEKKKNKNKNQKADGNGHHPPHSIKRRKGNVDIDAGNFGDYFDDDDVNQDATDSDDLTDDGTNNAPAPSETRPLRSRRLRNSSTTNTPKRNAEATNAAHIPASASLQFDGKATTTLGDETSLALRQRLLQLLSCVAVHLPKDFLPVDDLFLSLVEFINHLPFQTFQLLASSSILPFLSDAAQTSLCEMLLFNLLDDEAPDTTEQYLSQEKLEQCFLPFAARAKRYTGGGVTGAASGTAGIENAKASVLLEAMVRLLAQNEMLVRSDVLLAAVHEGIEKRFMRAQTEGKKNAEKQLLEEMGVTWLIESGERLVRMVNALPVDSEQEAG